MLHGIIVLAILLVISLAITAYFIYENRRSKSLKENPGSKKERNDSKDIYENPAKDDNHNCVIIYCITKDQMQNYT